MVVVDILEHAVPFAAVAWHTHMTGVLPVVGRALDHALLGLWVLWRKGAAIV